MLGEEIRLWNHAYIYYYGDSGTTVHMDSNVGKSTLQQPALLPFKQEKREIYSHYELLEEVTSILDTDSTIQHIKV